MKKSKKPPKAIRKTGLKKTDLAFTIDLLSTSMKCGHDIFSSINSLKDSIPEPLGGEFKLIIQQQKIGMAGEDVLIQFANRLKVPAIHQMVQALLMGIISGGSSATLLDQIAQDVRSNQVSFKPDKNLFELKPYKSDVMEDHHSEAQPERVSEVLKIDEIFLNTHGSMSFLREALQVGKNVLVFCHDTDLSFLLRKHFHDFIWIDLESEQIAQVLLSLSDSPNEKGKLLCIKASTIRTGFQRLKARLAFQEKASNALSVKCLLDLLYLIPLQISFTTTQSQQSWISEICELRAILEDGSMFVEPIFVTEMTGVNKDHLYLGHFRPTGSIPNLLEEIERNGGQVSRAIFI